MTGLDEEFWKRIRDKEKEAASYINSNRSYLQLATESVLRAPNTCRSVSPLALWKAQSSSKEQSGMQLFEYAVVYNPRDDEGNEISANAKVVTEPKTFFARTSKAVETHALQEIAGQSDLDLDFVRVIVRPFG